MQAEPSHLTGIVRRLLRLLSGVIVGIILLLIFERIRFIDALFILSIGGGIGFYLMRNEGHAYGRCAYEKAAQGHQHYGWARYDPNRALNGIFF